MACELQTWEKEIQKELEKEELIKARDEAMRAACEACRIIEKGRGPREFSDLVGPFLSEWWLQHNKEDESRRKRDALLSARKKLTLEELKAIQEAMSECGMVRLER